MRELGENEPLRLWLRRHLVQNTVAIDPAELRRSLFDEAEDAFVGGGRELLVDVLAAYGGRGAQARTRVGDGVAELVTNLDRPPNDRTYEARTSHATEPAAPASLPQAMSAAEDFFQVVQAALQRARFGRARRAADLARFETFRFASIAASHDHSVGVDEAALLHHIVSWHPHHGDDGHEELAHAFTHGVAAATNATRELAQHSLALKIVASNPKVTERITARCINLMNAVANLDDPAADGSATDDAAPPTGHSVNDDLAIISKSLFVMPRRPSYFLKRDREFGALRRIYEDAVPWSHRAGPDA